MSSSSSLKQTPDAAAFPLCPVTLKEFNTKVTLKEFNTAHKSLTALNPGHHAATTVTVTVLAPLLCRTVFLCGVLREFP